MAFSTMYYNENPRRANRVAFWIVVGFILFVIIQQLIARLTKDDNKWKYTKGILILDKKANGENDYLFKYEVDSVEYTSDKILTDSCDTIDLFYSIGKTFVVRYDMKKPKKGYLLACKELRE